MHGRCWRPDSAVGPCVCAWTDSPTSSNWWTWASARSAPTSCRNGTSLWGAPSGGRSTRGAVAGLERSGQNGHRRKYGPWVPEPGMWLRPGRGALAAAWVKAGTESATGQRSAAMPDVPTPDGGGCGTHSEHSRTQLRLVAVYRPCHGVPDLSDDVMEPRGYARQLNRWHPPRHAGRLHKSDRNVPSDNRGHGAQAGGGAAACCRRPRAVVAGTTEAALSRQRRQAARCDAPQKRSRRGVCRPVQRRL